MSNNNKPPLDIPDSSPVATGGLTMEDRVGSVNALKDVDLGNPEINQVAAVPQNLVQSAEVSTASPIVNKLDYVGISLVRDVKPGEKNDTLDIPEINQPDVTTRSLSHSDELTIGFLLDCATRGHNRGNQRPPSICKVSRILRDHSEISYEPLLVSIGPIHREDLKLKEFEWLKECYLDDLLDRCNSTPKKTLEAYLLKVNTLIPKIRESYAGVKKNYSDVELARMMVMDGCFILEFCFKHEEKNLYLPNKMQNSRIAMDLMLLENQVPFFVLKALFDCSMDLMLPENQVTLSQVLDNYFAPYIKLFRRSPEKNSILSNVLDKCLAPYNKLLCSLLPEKISTTSVDSHRPEKISTIDVDSDLNEKISTTDVDSDSTHDHVLGYLHKRYQRVAAKSSKPIYAEASKLVDEEQAAKSSNTVHAEASADEELAAKSLNPIQNAAFHSIVELDRSGMNFKPHQENEWSMTIKFQSSLFACLPWFWSKPTLLMPTLIIDDTTELILRNFIAYEQSFPQDCDYFTSYAHAMDMLIDTQEDVAKLVESKVLVNTLGSNQEAADMINKICKNMIVTDFYYTKEFKQMDKYYNDLWPKHMAWLKRVYFNNPWNIIALLAAIILFSLTVVQTIYTIRAA